MSNAPTGPTTRTYLSIGEALDALKVEFPDVTISKIRFFEGQGLVEPERTPSGYRKFTSVDVDRLRWVLRQQQESYIPLKIIRERLAEAEERGVVPKTLPKDTGASEAVVPESFGESRSYALGLGRRGPLEDLAVDGLDDLDDLGEFDEMGDADDEAPFDPNRGLSAGGSLGEESPESLGEFRHPAARARSAGLRPEAVRVGAKAERAVFARPSAPTPKGPEPVLTSTPSASGAAEVPIVRTHSNVEVAPAAMLGSANPMLGPSGGAALTFSELASSSGLSLDDLRLIEEFGLIIGRQKFDGKYYDDDALLVARTVVAFRAFGIEPRHLRMYKSAAEREAAFFAQALSPMLHRRGAEARTKATETINELRRLGEQLRDATLRNALRDVLEGR